MMDTPLTQQHTHLSRDALFDELHTTIFIILFPHALAYLLSHSLRKKERIGTSRTLLIVGTEFGEGAHLMVQEVFGQLVCRFKDQQLVWGSSIFSFFFFPSCLFPIFPAFKFFLYLKWHFHRLHETFMKTE